MQASPAIRSGAASSTTRTTRRISFRFATCAATATSGATIVSSWQGCWAGAGPGWVRREVDPQGRRRRPARDRTTCPFQRHHDAAAVGGHSHLSGGRRRREQHCLTGDFGGWHAGGVSLRESSCQSGSDERLYAARPLLLRSARGAPGLGEGGCQPSDGFARRGPESADVGGVVPGTVAGTGDDGAAGGRAGGRRNRRHPRHVDCGKGDLGGFDDAAHPVEHEENGREGYGKVPPGPQGPPKDGACLSSHGFPVLVNHIAIAINSHA